MAIEASAVRDTLMDLLFRDEEITDGKVPDGAVIAEGVMQNYAFHPGRVADAAPKIGAMLSQLPDDFHADRGGGMSFLNACMDRDGNHWGEHQSVEALMVLGIATKQATVLMPRQFWPAMPGGLPYFSVSPLPVAA